MADSVVMGTASADTVSFLKSTTGVVYDGGLGNDAITGSTKDDVIRAGAGADRVQGAAGNDSFVVVAGDLIKSFGSNNGQNGLIDQIIDFQGAGSNTGSGYQDKLVLYGFSSQATISFERYYGSESVHIYKVADPADSSRDGYIMIKMADGNSKLSADDVVFKAASIGGDITGDVVEAGEGVSGDADAMGKVTAELFDQGTSFKAPAAEALAGKYGNFTFNTDGSWTYHLDNSLDATQSLGRNDVMTETLNVQTLDGTMAAITVTVHGTNDAPTVTALNAGTVSEKAAPVVIDLLAGGQVDPDSGDVLSATNISVTDNLGHTVTFVNNGNGTITIDPSQYGSLNNGDVRTLTVSYGVSDGLATTSNTASLTINGVTDYDENRDGEATAAHGQFIIDSNGGHTLRGSSFADNIAGVGGTDTIFGGAGNDLLDGGPGIDTIWGGSGDDLIIGSTAEDNLYGGSGDDTISGGFGDDIIDGGTGNDAMVGGSGADTFVFRTNFGDDVISDFSGGDKMKLLGMGITDANFAAHVSIDQHLAYAEVTIDGNTITIFGLGANSIDKGDFLFA